MLNIEYDITRTIFFYTELPKPITDFFHSAGDLLPLKANTRIPRSMIENNLIMLKSGLICQAHYFSTLSKNRHSVLIIPNRLLDYQTLLTRSSYGCKVFEVAEDSEVLAVPFEETDRLSVTDTGLYRLLLKECGTNAIKASHLPTYIFTMPAPKKLQRFYYDMIRNIPSEISGDWITLPLKLSRQEISDILYVTTLSYDTIMTAWRKKSFVIKKEGKLLINSALFDDISFCPFENEHEKTCSVYKRLYK